MQALGWSLAHGLAFCALLHRYRPHPLDQGQDSAAGPHLLRPALQEPALGGPGESGEQRVQEQEPQFPKAGQDNGQEREGATRYNKVDVRTRFI